MDKVGRTERLIAEVRQRVAEGKLDLREVGKLLTGKFDQDAPALLLDALSLEREACARIADKTAGQFKRERNEAMQGTPKRSSSHGGMVAAEEIAATIRARSVPLVRSDVTGRPYHGDVDGDATL